MLPVVGVPVATVVLAQPAAAAACPAKAAGSTRTVGRAAADTIRSLNHALKGALGISLVTFLAPTPRPTVLHRLLPEDVPENGFAVFLNLLPDQGAPGLLAIRYLYSTVGIFGVPLWDPLHRQWNDGKLGIQRAGLWGPPPSSSLLARGSCCVLRFRLRNHSHSVLLAGPEALWQKPW